MDWIDGLLLGFSLGAIVMWAHFALFGLLRTREEWYAARMKRKSS